MLFRYRARNYPDTLTENEKVQWESYRIKRLTDPDGGSSIAVDEYLEKIKKIRSVQPQTEKLTAILDDLVSYSHTLIP